VNFASTGHRSQMPLAQQTPRVPVAALFENVEDGATVQNFLEWFPGVTPQQARSVLEHAAKSLEVA